MSEERRGELLAGALARQLDAQAWGLRVGAGLGALGAVLAMWLYDSGRVYVMGPRGALLLLAIWGVVGFAAAGVLGVTFATPIFRALARR